MTEFSSGSSDPRINVLPLDAGPSKMRQRQLTRSASERDPNVASADRHANHRNGLCFENSSSTSWIVVGRLNDPAELLTDILGAVGDLCFGINVAHVPNYGMTTNE